ncbi:LysM peptidoglycan-binding domain-containing protein [Dyella psychrodurans]|uniref:LysM peptidoglycan-binding domain-containing protein n=1 Tax=Dyella psychrodurans TaxID=1927960 RepID=A0A370WUV1_9GAMM|nr:substrate-binding domain-containing protein [Dyella psychrodurans]RDS79787.1 LysM peptidoglycan-binding domain-containing protein [Dyella psychrodurans]
MPVRITRLLSAALIGAALSTTAVMAATQSLTWRGDVVTANGVVKGMAKAWQSSGHGNLEIQPFNTASGLDAVASGAADIAGSARGSSGSAIDSNLSFTPVAWDGLVLVTSPSNPVSSLTLQQVHDIYYGRITNWQQVGGNDAPMDVFAVASPGDGVEYSLRKLVFGRGSQPVAAPRLYVNTTQLEQSVMLDPRAFGVTTLSSVAGNPRIKMLRIDGVAPSASTVASGAYPLFTELYLVTNPSSPNAAAAKSFIDFVQSAKGDAVLRSHSLAPYQGSPLIAMDASRRSRLLAEVGAHASAEPTQQYASAPAARPALAAAAAARPAVAAKSALNGVAGSVVAAPGISSLKGVRGDAFTEASASSRGGNFAKVTADAYVSYGKVAKSTTKSGKAVESTGKKAESKKIVSATKASTSSYRVGAGETLYSIARKHGVDVAQIRSWNHLKDNTVRTGQVLRIEAR